MKGIIFRLASILGPVMTGAAGYAAVAFPVMSLL